MKSDWGHWIMWPKVLVVRVDPTSLCRIYWTWYLMRFRRWDGEIKAHLLPCKAVPHENSGAATGRDVGWICLLWCALWSAHSLNLNPFLNFSFVKLSFLRPGPFKVQSHAILGLLFLHHHEVCWCFKTVFLWSHCYDAALLNGTDYCRETDKDQEMEAK